jgi:hypothetical protein
MSDDSDSSGDECLTRAAYVQQYARNRGIRVKYARREVRRGGLYKAYRKRRNEKRSLMSACGDCASKTKALDSYWCGAFCGQRGCRRFKVYLCRDCAQKREDEDN